MAVCHRQAAHCNAEQLCADSNADAAGICKKNLSQRSVSVRFRQEIQILLWKVSTGSRVQGKYRYVVLPFLCNRQILPAVEKENRL